MATHNPWPITFAEQRELAKRIRSIRTVAEQTAFENSLTDAMCRELKFMWGAWCRGPDVFKMYQPQHELLLPSNAWTHWLVLAGRGWG